MVRQLFRSGIAGLISAWVAAVPVAQAQQSTPTTPPAATAPHRAPAASDPWPRRLVSGTNTFLIYQPQLDSWKNNQLEAHAAVSVQAAGQQGSGLRRHLVHGAHRSRQGQPSRLPRGAQHHALELPLRPAERGGVDGGAPRARAGQAVQGHLARPARGGPRHRRREGRGRVAARSTTLRRTIIFSNVPAVLVLVDGRSRLSSRSRARTSSASINTSSIVLKADSGELYLHLFDGWMEASSLAGPVEGLRSRTSAGRTTSTRRSRRSSPPRTATR